MAQRRPLLHSRTGRRLIRRLYALFSGLAQKCRHFGVQFHRIDVFTKVTVAIGARRFGQRHRFLQPAQAQPHPLRNPAPRLFSRHLRQHHHRQHCRRLVTSSPLLAQIRHCLQRLFQILDEQRRHLPM